MTVPNNQDNIKGNRYQVIDKIGEGGMGAVYHVVDLLNDRVVALKQVRYGADELDFTQARADGTKTPAEQSLSNEFSILASLRHPNIVSVLDYGFDEQKQAYFTMDLLESPRTITEATQDLDLPQRVQLLVQLLQALDYLHHRSVIHRDLKPANVLVDSNNTVKVLDFGLALATDIVRQQQDKRSISGTLAYIAPEVLIGNPVSRASDMYAFGVIMYEVLKGDHPYDRSDTNKLIFGIVNEIPDTSEFDAPLASLLNRLLAKDPDDRFTNIRLVIERLCEAVGITPPTETLAIRESYLQASAFVGRDEEITELENLLQALTTTGAIRLIAGESGVGKSRLLSELRVRALVENINVVRGQAVSEGSTPFKIWRDVLRFILLYTEIEDREARILKYIMPRIDDVLGYEVGDVPQELRPQTLQLQLIEIISNLLKRQSKPIVLILEDLHWADQASIELIITLSRSISEYPVLLLGSYRSDEMPDLPQRISSAPIITLSRLTAEEITQLSSRMLGNVTLNDEITAFLQHETAGNIFFVIEILRLWAQEAGDLRTIAQSPIPDTLVAGGILAVLRQRVERLDTDAQQVLMYAAVFGREIDQTVLEAIVPETNIDDWLQDASAVAIIEVVDDKWRFVHDKLREYLLHKLQQDTTQWREHHRIVAEALETRYANDDLYIPSIAYHYHEARIADKAVIYLEQAGELVRASDYQESVNYLEALLSYDDILASYPKMRQAKFHAMLSTEHHLLGNSKTAEYHLLQFLHHSDAPTIPTNNIQAGLSILRQVGQQTLHRLLPTVFVGTQNRSDFSHHMYIALMNSASVYTQQGKQLQTLLALILSLNLVERINPSQEVTPTMSYGAMTYFTGLMNLHSLAKRYYMLAEQSIDRDTQLVQRQTRGLLGFYHAQSAEWDRAIPYIEEVIEEFQSLGDYQNADLTYQILAQVYSHSGQYQRAYEVLLQSYQRSRERQSDQLTLMLYCSLVNHMLHTGQILSQAFDDIIFLFNQDKVEETFATAWETHPNRLAMYYAVRAGYAFYLDDIGDAYQALADCMTTLSDKIERLISHGEIYSLIPQLCLSLLRAEGDSLKPEPQANLRSWLETSLTLLQKYAKIQKSAFPRYCLLRGYQQALNGEQATAINLWQDALQHAQAQNQPFDEVLANGALYQATNEETYRLRLDSLLTAMDISPPDSLFILMGQRYIGV